MEELAKFDKEVIKEFCQLQKLDITGSKRQLLCRLTEAEVSEEEIESFVEDYIGMQEKEKARLDSEKRKEEIEREKMAQELRQLELQCELERIRAASDSGSSGSGNENRTRDGPVVKLSQYMHSYEMGSDIGMFLTNFERLGLQLNVPQNQWATQLLKLLPNEVSAIVARMSANEASDYGLVKDKLLARFKLSPEAFRLRFRKAARQPEQPYSELGYYLESNLQEWITGSGADNKFSEFKELIAIEQLYELVPDHLRYWLLDRKPRSLSEACSLADEFESRRKQRPSNMQNDKKGIQIPRSHGKQFSKFPSPKEITSENGNKQWVNRSVENKVVNQGHNSKELNKLQDIICFQCGKKGHFSRACPHPKILAVCMPEKYKPAVSCLLEKYMVPIKVNDREVRSLRDTGATFDVISQSLVRPQDYTGSEACFRQAFSSEPCFLPLAKVRLEGKFGQLDTLAAVAKEPPADYLISNETANRCKEIDLDLFQVNVITRQKAKELSKRLADEVDYLQTLGKLTTPPPQGLHTQGGSLDNEAGSVGGKTAQAEGEVFDDPDDGTDPTSRLFVNKGGELKASEKELDNDQDSTIFKTLDLVLLPQLQGQVREDLKVTKDEFVKLQRSDESLKELFEEVNRTPKGQASFAIKEGLLIRKWKDKTGRFGDQLVLPTKLRKTVLELAHSHSLAGHLGVKKSKDRVMQEFYFPRIGKTMQEFVKTCPTCQKVGHGKDKTKAPLCKVPIISEPFRKICVDVVGPLPKSEEGFKYILTTLCLAARFPEGIPMKNLNSESVIDALLEVFRDLVSPSKFKLI